MNKKDMNNSQKIFCIVLFARGSNVVYVYFMKHAYIIQRRCHILMSKE